MVLNLTENRNLLHLPAIPVFNVFDVGNVCRNHFLKSCSTIEKTLLKTMIWVFQPVASKKIDFDYQNDTYENASFINSASQVHLAKNHMQPMTLRYVFERVSKKWSMPHWIKCSHCSLRGRFVCLQKSDLFPTFAPSVQNVRDASKILQKPCHWVNFCSNKLLIAAMIEDIDTVVLKRIESVCPDELYIYANIDSFRVRSFQSEKAKTFVDIWLEFNKK